jgi:uncharacterized membrane protein
MSTSSDSNLAGVGTLLIALTSVFSMLTLFAFFSPLSGVALSLSGVSFITGPMSLVGLILFLVGMNKLAHGYKKPAIFNGPLYSLLSIIVGFVAVFAFGFSILFLNIRSIVSTLHIDTHTPFVPQTVLPEILRAMVWYIVPIFVATLVIATLSAVFQLRGFKALAQESDVPRFHMVGLLFPVSAIVSAVSMLIAAGFVISGQLSYEWFFAFSLPGGLVQLAAWALATQTFFLLKAKTRGQAPAYSMPMASPPFFMPQLQGKFCMNCGYKNTADSTYCSHCGKPFNQPTTSTQP